MACCFGVGPQPWAHLVLSSVTLPCPLQALAVISGFQETTVPFVLCISTYSATVVQNFAIFSIQLSSDFVFIVLSLGNNFATL